MAIKTSKYKKVLTKKLSSTVILLILLALGVFAVVFNRFYLSPRAKTIDDPDSGVGPRGGGGIECYTNAQCKNKGIRTLCKARKCVSPPANNIDTVYGTSCLRPGITAVCGAKGSVYEDYVYTCNSLGKFVRGSKCEFGCIGNGICNQTCPTGKVFDRLHGGCMDKADFVSCTGNYTKSSSNCSTVQFDNDKNSIWCETPVTGEILFCCKAGFTKSDRAGNGGVMCI